ncbi:Protein CASPARIAN STRIP INTEGRITY FACTOR 1 [Bienertia sinuspersici]
MGFLAPRKLCLLFFIISALLISASFAGRQSRFLSSKSSAEEFVGVNEESPTEEEDKDESFTVHERMLRHMFTNDYGRYNPSPYYRRPRHKLIPN